MEEKHIYKNPKKKDKKELEKEIPVLNKKKLKTLESKLGDLNSALVIVDRAQRNAFDLAVIAKVRGAFEVYKIIRRHMKTSRAQLLMDLSALAAGNGNAINLKDWLMVINKVKDHSTVEENAMIDYAILENGKVAWAIYGNQFIRIGGNALLP